MLALSRKFNTRPIDFRVTRDDVGTHLLRAGEYTRLNEYAAHWVTVRVDEDRTVQVSSDGYYVSFEVSGTIVSGGRNVTPADECGYCTTGRTCHSPHPGNPYSFRRTVYAYEADASADYTCTRSQACSDVSVSYDGTTGVCQSCGENIHRAAPQAAHRPWLHTGTGTADCNDEA